MSRRKYEDCCYAAAMCPCGRIVALCLTHGGLQHQKPKCKEFRTMERGAYLEYVTRASMIAQFEEADSEGWPRA